MRFIIGTKKYEGLEGQTFNRLTALNRVEEKSKYITYYWICECGNTLKAPAIRVVSGNTKSCGCITNERIGALNRTHGESKTALYKVWKTMRARCYNTNDDSYHNYGGRGIGVCDEWRSNFVPFRDWAKANGYASGLTIERVNNNKGYSPENCVWTTRLVQCNNTRRNEKIEYMGELKTFAQWQRELGFHSGAVYARIHKLGWSIEEAFEIPLKRESKLAS